MSEQPANPTLAKIEENPSVNFESLSPDAERLFKVYKTISPSDAERWLTEALKDLRDGNYSLDELLHSAEEAAASAPAATPAGNTPDGAVAAELAATPAGDTVGPEIGTEARVDAQEDAPGLHDAAMALKPKFTSITKRADEMRDADKKLSFSKAVVLASAEFGFDKDTLGGFQVFDAYRQARTILAEEGRDSAKVKLARESDRVQRESEWAQYIDDIASVIAGDEMMFRKVRSAVRRSRTSYTDNQKKQGIEINLSRWPQGEAVLEAVQALVEDGSITSIDAELLKKIDSRTALASWKSAQETHSAQANTEATQASKSAGTAAATTTGRPSTTNNARVQKQSRQGGPSDLDPGFVNRVSPDGYLGDENDGYEQQKRGYRQRAGNPISAPRQAEVEQKEKPQETIQDGTEAATDIDGTDTGEETVAPTENKELADQQPLTMYKVDVPSTQTEAPAFGKKGGNQPKLVPQQTEMKQELEEQGGVNDTDAGTDSNEETAEPGSESSPVENEPLVLSFIDQTHDALAAARDAAETRRRNELQQGSRFKKFLKNVWMGENGLAGSYYLEKYKKESLSQIEQNNDVLSFESTNLDARTEAQLATIERFQSEYVESIHTDAGEQRTELEGDSEFSLAMKDLLRRYASGEITDPEALQEERGRILEQLNGSGNTELIGEGKVRIDNLLAIADQVKAMVGHGESIDKVLEGMKLYSAESRSNVRSEAHLGKIEHLVERLQKSKVGGLVGPETIGLAAAVSLGATRAGRGVILHALGVTVAPGVLGGAFAAVRESKRLKQERALHSREMAQGKRYDTGSRRSEIESTRYETVDANELTTNLEAALSGETITPDEVQAAYELIAQVEARIHLSDKRSIDLVSYSDTVQIEQERRRLDEARALAKLRLASHINELSSEYRTQFGITDGQPINESLDRYTNAITELDTDVDAKDKAYRQLRRRRVAKAAAIGAGTSLVFGLGTQELMAFASPSYDGLAEHFVHGGSPSETGRQTVFEGLVHGHTASTNIQHIAPSSTYESYPLGSHQHALELPSDYKLVTGNNGSMGIEGLNNTQVVDGLTLQKDGSLTPQSIALLKEHNVSIADTGHVVSHDVSTTKNLSVAEYNHEHAAATTHVTRDFWYDNNTAKFDKNELGLEWGSNGTGVNQNGAVQMNVSHMTQNGSSHGIEHTSWSHDAKDGKLKLAVSASRDTQAHPYFVDVKPDGTIDIPKDNPAAKFFSIDKSGHAQFNGAYAEVIEVRSEAGGVTHVSPLATVVGGNSLHHISETVTTKTHEYVPHAKLTPPAIEKVVQIPGRTVEGFGMPGFVPRRPLERLVMRRRRSEYGYNYDYNGEYGSTSRIPEDVIRAMESERSDTIANNPESVLHPRDELERYRNDLVSRRGADALRVIEEEIAEIPELAKMKPTVETVVTIPVGAAFESENIFNTLSLYAQQDIESLEKTLILVNVNQLDSVSGDATLLAKAQKTRQEIKRAREKFPQLQLAVIDHIYSKADADETGGVIGYAAQDLVDTSLLALLYNMKNGNISDDAQVLIQRHDADMLGMHRHLLTRLQEAAKQHKETDLFQGGTRLDIRRAEKFPGWSVADDIYNITTTYYSNHGSMHTGGANFAVRAETLAAVGGLGDLKTAHFGSGAGSDDSNIGIRVASARGASPRLEGYSSAPSIGSGVIIPPQGDRKILRHVGGMVIDTNAERFLPMYLRNEHWHNAWTPGVGSFNKGQGGYGARDSETGANTQRESFRRTGSLGFTRLEQVLSQELSGLSEDMRRRVLSSFFRGVPGAYQLRPNSGGTLDFTLTDSGRKYVRKQMVGDRHRRSYAQRKIEGMYGDRLGRTALGQQAPLVSAA